MGKGHRFTVQWRDEKLICPNGDEINPPWWLRMIDGRLYFADGPLDPHPRKFKPNHGGRHCQGRYLHLCACDGLFISDHATTGIARAAYRRPSDPKLLYPRQQRAAPSFHFARKEEQRNQSPRLTLTHSVFKIRRLISIICL